MNYLDLHADTLTKEEGVFHITEEALLAGGCALQCFAAFVDPRKGEGFSRASELADAYDKMCRGGQFCPFPEGMGEKICTLLTVEGGEALGGKLENLGRLYARGVRMLTLTWNLPNALGFPNFVNYGGYHGGHGALLSRETERGLTPFGRECVLRMAELGMIVDVSHGSDKLLLETAEVLKGTPFVASHSCAASVHAHPRNLTDGGIRAIAESGGAIGLCFCASFLSDDGSEEGQRAALLAHAEHILRTGGEDVLAIGSDFDGMPQSPYMRTAADMPRLLGEFSRAFGSRIAEKIAYENALRVLEDVLLP